MATMMECYPSQVFVDDEMKPLVSGRLTVYNHDTNVLANIYSLEGNDYVAMDNPVRLDEAGRLGASIFAELGVYDVKLERYNGDGTFEDFDNYEMGIDAKLDQIGRDSVKDIDALKDLDPTVCTNVVTVEEYPRRDYLWDPEAIDMEDGGVVIASDVSDHGRWLLLSDCPYIKSSVYGVINGEFTNINALFNFPRVIGSMNMITPTTIWLEPGNYNLDNVYVCSKRLAVGPQTQWTGTIQVPCDIEVLNRVAPETAYGNIEFIRPGCTAHSHWYKRVEDFWHCGADILVVDTDNHFSDSVLRTVVTLADKTVEGGGTAVTAYANSAYFSIAITSDIPDNFFIPSSDFVRISGSGIGDSIFRSTGSWDPGLINQGHHIQFDGVPDLDLFENTQRWVSTMVERRNRLNSVVWSDYTLDLQGRSCSNLRIDSTGFNTIKNANIGEIILAGYSTTFYNVQATLMVNSTYNPAIFVHDSKLTIPRYWANGLTAIQATDSDIIVNGAEGIDPCVCSISMYGGTWSGYVKMSEEHCNAYALSKDVSFRNVFISNDFKWKVNRIFMAGCTSSNPIDLYPAAGGDNFYYNCELHDNHFTGAFRLWITYWWNEANPHYEVTGSRVKFNQMSITDNRFDTNDQYGIKMTCYHVKQYSYFCCAVPGDLNMGTWCYKGNVGNCPKMSPGTLNNRGNWATMYEESFQHTQFRKAADNFNLFVPYIYDRSGARLPDEPSRFLDPSNQNQQVLGIIHGEDWNDSWAFACCWPVNGLSTPENLENEDYNNRFYTNVWMTRENDSVPNWQNVGEGKWAYTTFVIPGIMS